MRNEARLMRLMSDLDQVHRELSDLRLRTFGAPTLRDVVAWAPMAAERGAADRAGAVHG